MDDFDDYEILIDDFDVPEPKITKFQLIEIINKHLGKQWTANDFTHGVDVDVKPEWKQLLRDDGSILWEYTKLGWKAMHYQRTDQKGNIVREWLSFKSLNKKGKK